MQDLDRTYRGAVREIMRLCDRIKQLEADNKFLTEQLKVARDDRTKLCQMVIRWKDCAASSTEKIETLSEALRNQILTMYQMKQ